MQFNCTEKDLCLYFYVTFPVAENNLYPVFCSEYSFIGLFFPLREYLFGGAGHTAGPMAMKAPSSNHWTAREFPKISN